MYPIAVAIIIAFVMIGACCQVKCARRNILESCGNAIGTFSLIAFIPLSMVCATPFVCYYHPGQMRASVTDYPRVFYMESGEAVELLAISACAITLGPLASLAICTYATRAQVYYATTGNLGFLRTFGFFSDQVRLDTGCVGLIVLAWSFLLSFTPVIIQSGLYGWELQNVGSEIAEC